MCLKNISFFVFVGPGQKANFTKQRNQPRYTPRSSPLSPHHKIKIIKKCVYLMKMSHLPSLKENPHPLPHIVAIKSIIHLNIKIFVMKKERIAISLLESQSVETDIFSNFQQPLCFVL
jgi:hypothetical protein